MYIFARRIRFLFESYRPITILYKYIQPVEKSSFAKIHYLIFNDKLYNLTQNTHHEFTVTTEEFKSSRALELFLATPANQLGNKPSPILNKQPRLKLNFPIDFLLTPTPGKYEFIFFTG